MAATSEKRRAIPGRPRKAGAPEPAPDAPFVAIDFETADHSPDSACALALVRVEGLEIVERTVLMIRPPRARIVFEYLHGISWGHVRHEPPFGERWAEIVARIEGAHFLAAHNAGFDRSVLEACCEAAGLAAPALEYQCTVRLARRAWGLKRANLPVVCSHLGIDLVHHDPASDAEACARIVIAARREGVHLGPSFLQRNR